MRALPLVVLLSVTSALAADVKPPKTIAITGLKELSPLRPGLLELLGDVLVNEAAASQAFKKVFSNADLASLIGMERQRALLGCEMNECLAELQGALNVDLVLNGTVGEVGAKYRVSLTLLDARGGASVVRESVFAELDEEALVTATHLLVREVMRRYGGAAPSEATRAVVPGPRAQRRAWGLGIGAAGVAALASAVVFDALAVQRYQQQVTAAEQLDLAGYDRFKAESKQLGLTANVLYVAGAVVAAGGGALFLLSQDPKKPATPAGVKAALLPLPGGAWVGIEGGLP